MKTTVNAVQSWANKQIKNSAADWNQNDSDADNYVKNRTHWEEIVVETILPETILEFTEAGDSGSQNVRELGLVYDELYYVTWDGNEYLCICDSFSGEAIGDNSISIGSTSGNFSTEAPFMIWTGGRVLAKEIGTHTFKIEKKKTVVHKIDQKYLSIPDWNQNNPEGEGYIKNRPFYSEENDELILAEGSFFEEVNYMNHFQWDTLSHGFSPGDFVTIIFYEGYGWKELVISDIAEQNNGLTIFPMKPNLSHMIKSITCEYDASSGFTIDILAHDFQYVKVILRNKNAIHQIDSKYIKDMYCEDVRYITYIEEQEINLEGSSRSSSVTIPNINMPWDWVPYRVTFDGVEYEGIMTDNADNAWINITLNDGTGMTIYQYGHIYINSPNYAGPHTIKVEQKIVNITTLDSKYLDFSAWGGKNFDSYGVDTSIILNNKNNIASGWHSIAAGYYTEANGTDSFANGQNTIASGSYSHAEGLGNKAYAYASYAGGAYNIQYEYVPRQNEMRYSEVLCDVGEQCYYAYDYTWDYNTGKYTLVNPVSTTSIPPLNTYIIVRSTTGVIMYFNNTGIQKRSNRNLYDINAGHMKYTISYADRYDEKDMDLPLVTIGNGKSNTRRSNAYTLDRSGNGWFAGDIYVGSSSGTNKDEGSKKLITLDDITNLTGKVLFDNVITFKYNENDRYYDFDTNLDLKENHLYKLIWNGAEVEITAWFNDTDSSPCLDIEDEEYGTVWVVRDHVQLSEYNGQVPSVSRKLTIIDLEENVQEIKEELIPNYLARVNDIPEIESQVFIVTHDSVNDYDDLGEAIYNASREGKVVVFQDGDHFYDLAYSEIEPSHAATFTQARWDGHVTSIQISYSEITRDEFDTKNYVDTAIADKADKAALESLQTQVTATSLILADTITGQKYTIQIQNGQLVSSPIEG